MQLTLEPKYEEQYTAFIDFLGFSEVSRSADDSTRLKILDLLKSLSELRGEFDVQSTAQETGKMHQYKPAISTFSDHIVISYPLGPISAVTGHDEHGAAFVVMVMFNQLLTRIAAAALRIGSYCEVVRPSASFTTRAVSSSAKRWSMLTKSNLGPLFTHEWSCRTKLQVKERGPRDN